MPLVEFSHPCFQRHKMNPLRVQQTQKCTSRLLRTQNCHSLKKFFLVDQNIIIHALHTAGNFAISNFYLSGPFNSSFFFFYFSESSVHLFLALVVANTGSLVGPWNKLGNHLLVRWVPVLEAHGIYK